MTRRAASFEHAARYERELSERQREVLRLVADGKTNPQIADALDMTLAGAKWHVSEILTKLGLESREQAIAFDHWYRRPDRRFGRMVRGLVAFPLAKAIAGAGVSLAVAGAGLGAWTLVSREDAARATPIEARPFYLEATVTQRPIDGGEQRSVVRWWYRDQNAWRWEINQTTPVAYTSSGWLEDGSFYRYDGRTDSYSITPLASFQADASPRWWAPWVPHWFGTTSPHTTVAEFLDWWASFDGQDGGRVVTNVAGAETLDGRQLTIVEVTWTNHVEVPVDSARPPTLARAEVREVGRFWIDPERMMVLRHEVVQENPVSSGEPPILSSATVTRLDYDVVLTRADLESGIPAGARPGLKP